MTFAYGEFWQRTTNASKTEAACGEWPKFERRMRGLVVSRFYFSEAFARLMHLSLYIQFDTPPMQLEP